MSFENWTLRRRLVVGVSALLGVVIVLVGVVSVGTVRASLLDLVDAQVTTAMSSLQHSTERARLHDLPAKTEWTPEAKPMVDFAGQAGGSVIALVRDGEVIDSAFFGEPDPVEVPAASQDVLIGEFSDASSPHTVDLGGDLGSYRMMSVVRTAGGVLIAGIPLASVETAVAHQALGIGLLGLGALAITALGGALVVRVALRPLDRVVATATEVSALPLTKSETLLANRVPGQFTDPRTEVGKVGAALNRLLGHVSDALAVRDESDRRIRRFVTDASHELRTPLASIQGYAELTRHANGELPDLVENSLARIEAEAHRMTALVGDLLLLSRLDERQDLQIELVDMSRIVADAVSDSVAAGPDHTWILEVPDHSLFVLGDPARLHQVLANILSNARIHTPAGTSITTSLALREDADGDRIVVTIADDGPGISEDLLPVVFERFARGDSSRSRRAGSTGLGLAIVSSVVDAHGGSVSVRLGEGATFVVDLPAAPPTP